METGDGYNEDSDAWLDGSIDDLVDEHDPGYLRCSNRVFVGLSKDACLDGPELCATLLDVRQYF